MKKEPFFENLTYKWTFSGRHKERRTNKFQEEVQKYSGKNLIFSNINEYFLEEIQNYSIRHLNISGRTPKKYNITYDSAVISTHRCNIEYDK